MGDRFAARGGFTDSNALGRNKVINSQRNLLLDFVINNSLGYFRRALNRGKNSIAVVLQPGNPIEKCRSAGVCKPDDAAGAQPHSLKFTESNIVVPAPAHAAFRRVSIIYNTRNQVVILTCGIAQPLFTCPVKPVGAVKGNNLRL